MDNQWIANIVGKMHINKITNIELSEQLNCTPQYVSMVLNGKKTPKSAEKRFNAALDTVIAGRSAK